MMQDSGMKCILILTPNYLSNSGWTKQEFNSIFTREIIENKNVVLPIWDKVTKKDVYDYSPNLADRFAAHWSEGQLQVASKIARTIRES
ncbi:MAG: toll/interleukin-1 receptor domain-containing protein [Nitrospinae bacterium]|nr:toll/interleukin-1 receptor domain-containing protein [Nitrospinota bacterium]